MGMGMGGLGCGLKLVIYVALLFMIISMYGSVMRFFTFTYWWMYP